MVVNPFFLHGSTQEQNLQQSLVNEQLRMYGLDVYYIPRTFVRDATIMREITSSAFRSYFIIEAYLNNFDGYGGQGDIMSKFGIQVKDEVTLTISRERYEDYIAPFLNSRMMYLLNSSANDQLPVIHRPREGDLIYFPLGRRLFEIKFVEHEQPFYQLGKGYTYELQCELFEYEDEILDTSIDEIDSRIQNKGFINTLKLVPLSNRAEVSATIDTGYIKDLTIFNEGNNYIEAPAIQFNPTPLDIKDQPKVVALLTAPDSNIIEPAIKQLITFSRGAKFTEDPEVTAVGGGGTGSVIRAGVNTTSKGIVEFTVTNSGAGYPEDAIINVFTQDNFFVAQGLALTDGEKIVQAIVTDPGEDLPDDVKVVVGAPAVEGEGIYLYNEIVVGKESGMKARVRGWNALTFELEITNLEPEEETTFVEFKPGEIIEGEKSGARYSLQSYDDSQTKADAYSQNEEIQEVADVIVDTDEYNQFLNPNQDNFSGEFSEDNPFGE